MENIFYIGFSFYKESLIQKQNVEKSTLLAKQAQLEMLRYQLNPHFLFNTFSTLRALVRNNKNIIAEKVITKISEFLKYSLLEGEDSFVNLSKEISIINHYLDIEKIRFGEKLDVTFDIDPNTESIMVPVFLIHPIIENAVKHGMKTSPSPLVIIIKTRLFSDSLIIEVSNSGKWIEKEKDDMIICTGLENTKKRLKLAYPEMHSYDIIKKEDHVKIKIIINNENT